MRGAEDPPPGFAVRSANTSVDLTFFEGMAPEAQARWIHAHDVIVSPHGAQLSNLVFARPCTAVVEIFEAGKYLTFYGTLTLAVGGVHFVATTSRRRRLPSRDATVGAEASVVAAALPCALEARRECLRARANATLIL